MSSQSFRSGDVLSRVPRGSACLSCRRRKMRCDGVRPVCGPCRHMEREYDCEYTDGSMPSPTQLLEQNVAQLEARIRELESAPVSPVAGPSRQPRHREGSSSPAVHVGVREGPSVSDPSNAAISSDPAVEPHPAVIRLLISIFVPIASQVGFFLNLSRFLNTVYTADTSQRRTWLSPCLLDAVLLWGAGISTNNSIRAYEDRLLSRAVQSISDALPQVANLQQNAVHVIQAEILLANYFFCQNRYLEGTYHCSAAVALVMSCRLHRIRSANSDAGSTEAVRLPSFNLPPPVDSIEEGERICAFWSVYTLDRSWSAAQGSLVNDIFGEVQIDTPWPAEMSLYEEGGLAPDLRSLNTVNGFFNNSAPLFPGDGSSSLALRAKAGALFERATRLASQLSPNMANFNVYSIEASQLDSLIRHFIASLPPAANEDLSTSPEKALTILIAHTFAHAAIIRLHTRVEIADSILERHDVTAARSATALLNVVTLDNIPFLDPILAMLWTVVGQALIGGLYLVSLIESGLITASLTSGSAVQVASTYSNERQALLEPLTKILTFMRKYTNICPLMNSQVTFLDEELQKQGIVIM